MNLTLFKPIVVLTGAGISAESGIRTFRDGNGLWENHRIEDVASPGGFARNPALVYDFYNQRRRQLKDPAVQPNAAHLALAKLEQEWEGPFLLVTQNVDNLHERAGSKSLLHMHGSLTSALCRACGERYSWSEDLTEQDECRGCRQKGSLRPDIVWFGEMPHYMEEIGEALNKCEIFISIGTSGVVYPAAGFAQEAWRARRIEINLKPSEVASKFHEQRIGPATAEVPKFFAELLGE